MLKSRFVQSLFAWGNAIFKSCQFIKDHNYGTHDWPLDRKIIRTLLKKNKHLGQMLFESLMNGLLRIL
ncbi:MAG: hypothetical protein DRR08_14485 [Candidatus Parabeggiatoa sp. nov. 2]|nr:MAG: hypothetical protein B6247_15655 [Beggiatoa sp. 4572_84]RKZ59240.1 MAG: hypothetical protein DRR08_14485 [Gammaproteobacteria bacterium]